MTHTMAENEIRRGKGRLGRLLKDDGSPEDFIDTLTHILKWQEYLVTEGVVKRHLLTSRGVTFSDELTDYEVIELFSVALYEIISRRFKDTYGEDDCSDGSERVGQDDSSGDHSSA